MNPIVNSQGEFVTEADWIPSFWQFLVGLDRNDLIAELVQNDIDQEATHTIISFEEERLISEGNGQPVDSDGWRRLRSIYGAGHMVPAKRAKIGVKNHGLKTAFTLGDQIDILSGGRMITQTLYANGPESPPFPGAFADPVPLSDAPPHGCRIVITYRKRVLKPREGEAIILSPTERKDIDNAFRLACAAIPQQFAGIVSPDVMQRYEITLRHWNLGEVHFLFSSTRASTVRINLEIFRRRCLVGGSYEMLPLGWQEEAVRRYSPISGTLKKRISDFYRRKNRFFVEVSWPINHRGTPQANRGRFRYPIGYPHTSQEAITGHGVTFNAPFVSDTERHSVAKNDSSNENLHALCEKLLLDAMEKRVVPKWGSQALNLLVPQGSTGSNESVRALLVGLLQRNAIPKVTWNEALRFHTGGKDRKITEYRRVPRTTAPRYQFVIPMATWDEDSIHVALGVISPPHERQLDPRISSAIISLLADGKTEGFGETFVMFDENAAFTLARGERNEEFSEIEDINQEFAKPLLAGFYLDLIFEALSKKTIDRQAQSELQRALLLPDMRGIAVPILDLYSGADLPVNIPNLKLPEILHAHLAHHSLFRRSDWRRPTYRMANLLDSLELQELDERSRNLFWLWLRRTKTHLKPRDRIKLADLPIWPDIERNFLRLSDLCEPRSPIVASVLGGWISRPHEEVRRSSLVSRGNKGRTSIRSVPSEVELANWLDDRIARFAVGEVASISEQMALEEFESELLLLMKDVRIAKVLSEVSIKLPALAQDHSIQWRRELVQSELGQLLALPHRFVLKRNYRTILNTLEQPLSEPTVQMILTAFAEDSENVQALQPRLHEFLRLTDPGDEARQTLAGMAILPVDGSLHPPKRLAFLGGRGSYWGQWKLPLSAKGLSQDQQVRYVQIGVLSAVPTQETSREFFEWLAEQSELLLAQHLGCVLRHLLHDHGPKVWSYVYTDIPFIPVRNRLGLKLVSLAETLRNRVFVGDLAALVDSIIARDADVFFVVDKVPEVVEPVTDVLRRLGVRSLRESLNEPHRVSGNGRIQESQDSLVALLDALKSTTFRKTFLKRLDTLGVMTDLVWHDWHNRLTRIMKVRFAENVQASYQFRRRQYTIDVGAGFDPMSGIFWLAHEQNDIQSAFCEAIAKQLVFKPQARPIDHLALQRALQIEIVNPTFWTGLTETEQNDVSKSDNFDVGEALFGHSPFEPDLTKNFPNPRRIPTSLPPRRRRNHRRSRRKKDDTSPPPKLEKYHIDDLKSRQYAAHCQMCLCERPPEQLAPTGSYVEWAEVRRRIVEAHHVDPKSGMGARHAGNLILLCKLHHDNYGRRLTRDAVIAALQEETKSKTVRFSIDKGKPVSITGREVEVVLADRGDSASIFFTNHHADFWLEHNLRKGVLDQKTDST